MENIPFLPEIAQQGILGLLLAISLLANAYQFKINQDTNKARIEDLKEQSSKFLDPINASKANSDILISLFTKFLNGSTGGNGH